MPPDGGKQSSTAATRVGLIGVAAYPASGATAQTLLKAGDAAMYAAKHRGKRQCVPFAG